MKKILMTYLVLCSLSTFAGNKSMEDDQDAGRWDHLLRMTEESMSIGVINQDQAEYVEHLDELVESGVISAGDAVILLKNRL